MSRVSYFLTLFLFVLALLCKPMVVTLPFVMLLLDFWPLRRNQALTGNPRSMRLSANHQRFFRISALRPFLSEKLPFFFLSFLSCVITLLAQKAGGALADTEQLPTGARLANAITGYITYLRKALWPADLAAFYPYPPTRSSFEILAALVVFCAISAMAIRLSRRAPYLLVGWLWCLGMLVPVIGLVQVGSQAVADRYTYLPLVGIFVMGVWGAGDLLARCRSSVKVGTLVSAGVLAGYSCATWVQEKYWQDSLTLFRRDLAVFPENNVVGHHNLGQALATHGDVAGALRELREAIRIQPGFAMAQLNLANSLSLQSRFEEANIHYQEAIRLRPSYAPAYKCLASSLVADGRLEEARTNLETALLYKPDYAEAHTKLGNVLTLQGAGAKALAHLQAAVAIDPAYADGQYFLAGALARQKRFEEAARCFRAAIKARPDDSPALNDLAWLLATQADAAIRNVPEAVRLAQRACELTHYAAPAYLDTLAVAYSEAGQLKEATGLTEKAAALATNATDGPLAAQLKDRLTLYHSGQSYTQRHTARPADNSQ